MLYLTLSDNCKVGYYASIKEMPIEVSRQFNAYILQDIGIGSTFEAVDNHLQRITMFLEQDRKADAIEEIKNLRYGYFSMISKWDYKSLAFGCLVATVNGQPAADTSLEGIHQTIKFLSDKGLTVTILEDLLENVKKNLIPSDSYISPNISERILAG